MIFGVDNIDKLNHGILAPTKPQSTSEKPSFNCGVVPINVGINVPISMKEKVRFVYDICSGCTNLQSSLDVKATKKRFSLS